MFFAIEFSDGLAIYEQIVRQVKYAVAAGALKPDYSAAFADSRPWRPREPGQPAAPRHPGRPVS
jgi:hypothetical protein